MERLSRAGVDANLVETGGVGADPILEVAGEGKFELVVIATRRRSWLARFLLGSTAETVARRAPVPVLLVRRRLKEGKVT